MCCLEGYVEYEEHTQTHKKTIWGKTVNDKTKIQHHNLLYFVVSYKQRISMESTKQKKSYFRNQALCQKHLYEQICFKLLWGLWCLGWGDKVYFESLILI